MASVNDLDASTTQLCYLPPPARSVLVTDQSAAATGTAEEEAEMHRTRLLSERSRPKLKTSSRRPVQIGVQDSVAILQFDVRNGERETARAFEAQAASLSSNPLNILCVVIHLSGGVSTGLTASARSLHLIETAIRKLRTLNVPIVCSASGTIHGVAALILRAADYSIADELSLIHI